MEDRLTAPKYPQIDIDQAVKDLPTPDSHLVMKRMGLMVSRLERKIWKTQRHPRKTPDEKTIIVNALVLDIKVMRMVNAAYINEVTDK
jgi:hypothetical protein